MTIMVNGYEIEIKAKQVAYDNRANKESAISVLNTFAMYASEAAERYDQLGLNALAKRARMIHNDLYNELEAAGAYKNLG